MTQLTGISSRNLHKSFSGPIYTDLVPHNPAPEATMSTVQNCTEELAAAVEQVPGVDELYPAAGVLTTVLKQAVGALTQKPTQPELVRITESEDGLRASVSIGISDGAAATDVCRRVYDTIEEYFVASGEPAGTNIEVTVARIG
jgi:hypothetical protein